MSKLVAFWNALPIPVQKFVADFWTAILVGLAGFTIVVPSGDYSDWLYAIGLALGNVVLNALRRAVWDFITGA